MTLEKWLDRRTRSLRWARRCLAAILVAACVRSPRPSGSSLKVPTAGILQDFKGGLTGVHTRNPALKLRVDQHPTIPNERVLTVDYPPPSDDPAGRDVWLDVEQRDWTGGRAIEFRVKPDHPSRLSVSFADRNHVAFTTWIDLRDTVWQNVRLDLATIRPNPYFQPPNAVSGKPKDLSEVNALGFAPQDREAGRIAIGRIALGK